MTTANARTNAIGHTISGVGSYMGDLGCKTEQFKISRPDKFGGHFLPEDKLHKLDNRTPTVGDLISNSDDRLSLIARNLFDAGMPLTARCVVMVCQGEKRREAFEVWTEHERFQVVKGRVYGHRILGGHWHIPKSSRGA